MKNLTQLTQLELVDLLQKSKTHPPQSPRGFGGKQEKLGSLPLLRGGLGRGLSIFARGLVLLELVAKGQGKWSWYELANALSRRDVPREPDMMVVLKKLAADGLVKRYVETNSPPDRWELTPEGSMVLANPKADSQS